ncbi:putative proline-specific permease put4 [Colletotrichum spaethianum]|uniref:proline--tRNA ligase n=1 Tax=Colletotrichum spaethianum TaxID=700344 RepID=A0AA37PA13_9PEZI|nr:putative proline-specific permease put4 [Colletotrichum spaethianum]GKT48402.1 putative proline-specific permease put4 [Colletotrichum spaethianum]
MKSHSGVFHLLPLGRRVQDKLEHVIDYYMQELGAFIAEERASRVALSTITSKDLWQKSGRLAQLEPELFSFDDRKGTKYMLSPTHEEEITTLVAKTVKSYKELPLRLYQITRKFRDELRPRHGLLRTREFTMKDLYTFDVSTEAALKTYEKVQSAYAGVFNALKLPVLVARASSGDMGGDLSHEYHLPTAIGEDTVVTCNTCDYAVNAEIAETRLVKKERGLDTKTATESPMARPVKVWRGISRDRSTLCTTVIKNGNGQLLNLLAARVGDGCPSCDGGVLQVQKALEVGHTFHLGTRYSEPLGAVVSIPGDRAQSGASESTTLMQMGCHGIGVSRLIGAVVEHLADSKGLQWPRAIAPYEVVVIPTTDLAEEAVGVYDEITTASNGFGAVDAVLDDRTVSLTWKLKDADLVGYPVLVVLGKVWKKDKGTCEVQCRRLGINEMVPLTNIRRRVSELLEQL